MNQKSDYIAVFDSGVGGISVLRQLRRELPRERFLYFGDSANAPYGSRPAGEILELTFSAAEKLMARGIKALVIGCNTATAVAIEPLREKYPDLIIVGIEPAVKLAVDRCPRGTIGVMATQVTLKMDRFRQLLDRWGGSRDIVPLAVPGLVELIEAGQGDSPACQALLEPILSPWQGKLDALVLGCTHYPFAAGPIRRILGDNTLLLDGSTGTARETRRRLEQAGLLFPGPGSVLLEDSLSRGDILALARKLLNQPG